MLWRKNWADKKWILHIFSKSRAWLLQEDNDPKQALKSAMNYFKKHKLKFLEQLSSPLTWTALTVCEVILKKLRMQKWAGGKVAENS